MRASLPALALLCVTAACTTQAPGSAPPPAVPSLVGAWRSSVQVSTGAFATAKGLEFMYVIHADGTLTESSNYDAAPPVPPAYGVWRKVAPNAFEAKYEFFTTSVSPPDQFRTGAGWLPSGRGVFTERITIAADGRTFTSVMRYQLFDVAGQSVDGGGEAHGSAVRITF